MYSWNSPAYETRPNIQYCETISTVNEKVNVTRRWALISCHCILMAPSLRGGLNLSPEINLITGKSPSVVTAYAHAGPAMSNMNYSDAVSLCDLVMCSFLHIMSRFPESLPHHLNLPSASKVDKLFFFHSLYVLISISGKRHLGDAVWECPLITLSHLAPLFDSHLFTPSHCCSDNVLTLVVSWLLCDPPLNQGYNRVTGCSAFHKCNFFQGWKIM